MRYRATCHLLATDFRCDSYGFLLTINLVPSESGTSVLGFFILMCSAWKLPSIIKPHMKRFLLKQSVGSFQVAISIDAPIFILFPIFSVTAQIIATLGIEPRPPAYIPR